MGFRKFNASSFKKYPFAVQTGFVSLRFSRSRRLRDLQFSPKTPGGWLRAVFFSAAFVCLQAMHFNADGQCTPTTYTWIGGNGDFQTAANWTPNRTTLRTCDVLLFNSGTTVAPTNVPDGQEIGQWIVTNNTTVVLNSSALIWFSGSGATSTQTTSLQIDAGSVLDLGPEFNFRNRFTGCNVQISGTFRTADSDGFSDGDFSAYRRIRNPNIVLNAGSTIEYTAASGTQYVTPRDDYRNLVFSGGATKLMTNTTRTAGTGNTVTITDGIVDAGTYTFGERTGSGNGPTNLVMTGGTLRLGKVTSSPTLPELTGTYTLTGGTIELYGTDATRTQNLRESRTYHNVIINALAANKDSDNGNASHAGTVTVNGTFDVNSPAVYGLSSTNIVDGPGTFRINTGAGLFYGHQNGITTAACGTGASCGNVRTANRSFAANSLYGFIGAIDNMASGNGLPANVSELIIRRTAGSDLVTLSGAVTVNNSATFTRGLVVSSQTNLITFGVGSSAIGASDNSYVQGPVRKEGSTDFTFPVGGTMSGTRRYRHIGITGVTGPNNNGQHFTAQYFPSNSNASYPHLSRESSLSAVSAIEHWILDRTGGSPNARVVLSWVAASGVGSLSNLRVGRWNGSQWRNEGNSTTAGTTASGTVTSGVVNSFSPFALASEGGFNPLPVTWLGVEAVRTETNVVRVQWQTASETNNAHFEVERSADARTFQRIATVVGAGNSSVPLSYETTDQEPLAGVSYYRVRQIDLDGQASYSKTVAVHAVVSDKPALRANPVAAREVAFRNLVPGVRYELQVFNTAGVQTYGGSLPSVDGEASAELPALVPSVYVLKLTGNGATHTFRLVKL